MFGDLDQQYPIVRGQREILSEVSDCFSRERSLACRSGGRSLMWKQRYLGAREPIVVTLAAMFENTPDGNAYFAVLQYPGGVLCGA